MQMISAGTRRPVCLLIAGFLFLLACSKEEDSGNTGACQGPTPSFASNVLPLMQTKCAVNSGCHGTGAVNSGGPLTNFTQIKAKAASIRSQVNAGLMPQGSSLSAAEKSTILCWVDGGAPNN
jgi:hypothetical protein